MTIFHSKKLLTQVENGLSPMVTPPLSLPSRNDNQFPHLMTFSCTPLALSDFSAYIMFLNRGQISEFSLKSSKKEDHSSGCDLRVCTSLLRFRLLRTTHPTRVKSYKRPLIRKVKIGIKMLRHKLWHSRESLCQPMQWPTVWRQLSWEGGNFHFNKVLFIVHSNLGWVCRAVRLPSHP